MDNRQLKNLGLVILLPILFAGFGYFGMKVFLSGSGPKTVMPEKNNTSIVTDVASNTEVETDTQVEADAQTGRDKSQSQESKNSNEGSNEASNKASSETSNKQDEPATSTQSKPSTANQAQSSNVVTDESETQSIAMETYEFPSVNFFSLQVGSYSSLSNAQKHVEALKNENIESYVFHGNNYKVMAGVNSTREGVDLLKSLVEETIPDAFVKGLVIVPDTLKYEKGGDGEKAFGEIVSAYNNRINNHIVFLSSLNTGEESSYDVYLQNDLKSIEEISDLIIAYNGNKSFKNALSNLEKILNDTDQKVRQNINGEKLTFSIFDLYVGEIMSYNKIN